MIVLSVSHVKKAFGTETVLRDVSLTLAQRERMGLVGVNGSGKTTLLKILAGQLSADEGAVCHAKGHGGRLSGAKLCAPGGQHGAG